MIAADLGFASLTWRFFWRRFPFIAHQTFPDLNGTWKGTMVRILPDDYAAEGTIFITQTLLSLSIKLTHPKAHDSYSTRYVLDADPKAPRFRILYSYEYRPAADHATHEGSAYLELATKIGGGDCDFNHLVGRYYSDRGTTGMLDFHRVLDEGKA